LSYLRSFPFDKIKIDRSFMADIGRQPDSLAIIDAVVSLGQSLDMATTAEGIETEEQLATVLAQGCDEAQGYLLSPPLPASAARTLLDTTARQGFLPLRRVQMLLAAGGATRARA
jgi:EAL domain-containing protein (putative c-di-GMP-specific phosphodiesterase class I)